MSQLLLEENVGERKVELEIFDRLSKSVERLADQVTDLQGRIHRVEKENVILLRLLSPLYKALKPVFGDLEPVAELGETQSAPRNVGVWDAWKKRLTPNAGKVIDALLTHGDLNSTQLSIATGINSGNVAKYVYEVNKAGLINKNGGRFSLKQL